MMHILFIPAWWPSKTDPTAGIFIQKQAEAVSNLGHQVGALVFQNRLLEPFFAEKSGLFVEKINQVNLVRQRAAYFFPKKNKWLLSHWAAQFDSLFEKYVAQFGWPEIIHAVGFQAVFVAERLSFQHKIPFVFTEQASVFRQQKVEAWLFPPLKKSWENAAKVVAVSEGLKNSMLDIWPTGQIEVVPNLFLEKDFNLIYSKLNKRFTLLTVCALEWKKGLDILLAAYEKLCFSNKNSIELIIVGDGKERAVIQKLVNKNAFSSQIKLTGALTSDKLLAQYQQADAFVLASRHETFGTVVVEAMACGLPIVATRCGGPEFFVTEKDGLIVEPENVEQLVLAMNFMVNNYTAFNRTEIKNRAWANFSEKTVAERLVKIYQEVYIKTL